jgi:hypothetical protein
MQQPICRKKLLLYAGIGLVIAGILSIVLIYMFIY